MKSKSKKLNIGVFFGSRTPEHDVSIASAYAVMMGLAKNERYNVLPIYITRDGKWLYNESFKDIKSFKDINEVENKPGSRVSLLLNERPITLQFKKGFSRRKIVLDMAFPVFHGSNGEDGSFQGLFELLDVSYCSSGILGSALGMDKTIMKDVFKAHNVPIVKYLAFLKDDFENNKSEVIASIESEINYPIFVKPNRLGSSIGVSKVQNKESLIQAIEVAIHFDDKFIIEEGVEKVKEINCSVRRIEGKIKTSLTEEVISQKHFLTFEDKYLSGGGTMSGAKNKVNIPANVPEEINAEIQNLSKIIFKVFNCGGVPRIDFLYDAEGGKLYVNEINTIPGALQAHLWKKSGVEFVDLLDGMVEDAIRAHKEKKAVSYEFQSNIVDYTTDFQK